MTEYEKAYVLLSRERADTITKNLRARGIKAYYMPCWVVMKERVGDPYD